MLGRLSYAGPHVHFKEGVGIGLFCCLSALEAISSLLNSMIVSHLLNMRLVLNASCALLRSRAVPFHIVEVKKLRPEGVE